MFAKFVAIACLIGITQAGYLHGSGLGYASGIGYGSYGYGGYGGYGITPAYYSAPLVKSIAPVLSYAPAVSTVSRYDIHSAPILKSYVSPVASYSYSPGLSYGGYGYGHGDYGYGGYSGKYYW